MDARTTGLLVVAGLAMSTALACDALDEALDCQDVCARYADCHEVTYEIGDCASQCRDRADADRDYADQASACETCLDDRSCDGSTVCVDECAGVLP